MTQASAPRGSKLIIATAITATLLSLISAPAIADRNDKRQRTDQHRQQSHQSSRGWHGERETYSYQPNYRRSYSYAQPVYVPQPIYYEPRQSPGISFFFPLEFRR